MNRIMGFAAGAFALAMSHGASAQVNLSAETASPAGTPGASVLALAEVASKAGVADIQVATGQTLTNSVQNVAEGKTDITAAPFILPFLLSRGVGPYAKTGEDAGAELASNLAVLYTYRISVQGLFAYDSSQISGWDGIEGKTVFNGPPRGAALTNARNLARLVTGLEEGTGYNAIQVNWGQAVKTMREGSADAFVLPMSFPDGRINAAIASGDMTIWSLPKDVYEGETFKKFASVPGTLPVSLPIADMGYTDGVTVISEDDTFRGPGTMGGEVVNVSMDFETAKALTTAFINGLETYHNKATFMPNAWHGETGLEFSNMCGRNPLKYHPGAVAAWEEAGHTIPDCAK